MADVVSKVKRSQMMSGIRAKNTRPEILVRRALFARGLRFRLHDRKLPGTPDLVLRKYRTAVLVHGCFWHGHDCHLFKVPTTRRAFWLAKIRRNQMNDDKALKGLHGSKWKVVVIWECALKGRTRLPIDIVAARVERALNGKKKYQCVQGRTKRTSRSVR